MLMAAVAAGAALYAAEVKGVSPAGSLVVGPYAPGLLAGRYLYVSGQGALNSKRELPATTAEQTRQCLANVKQIVEAAGLTMEHIVYSQLYLTDPGAYGDALKVWREFFPDGGPARAVLGVAKMPADTPVEVNAVAVRDLSMKRVIRVNGQTDAVVAGDRLFFSGCGDLEKLGVVLKAAGIGFDHVVFVNPYLTSAMPMDAMNRVYAKYFRFGDTPARATIMVSHLPENASVVYTGVAAMDLAARRSVRPKNMPPSATASPCVFVSDTLYCSAKSAFIPGPNQGIYAASVANQVRQTMRNLLDGLEEAGMDFSNVVATNVYLDDIRDFAEMNRVYASYFRTPYPTRTTVQQRPPVERKANEREHWPTLEQISLVAVR
jgi:reactive intermediate/imine deaminase